MALLTAITVPPTGIRVDNVLTAAAGGGDTFSPSERHSLIVNNGGGGAITVTVVTPATTRGLAIADAPAAVSVGAGQRFEFGPFPYELYADPTTGFATITYSGVTSVTVGIFYRPTF